MTDLADFGKIARKYIGRGKLFQVDDSDAECDFEIAQYANAKILLMCKYSYFVIYRQESHKLKFEGLTTEGKRVHIEGQAINIHSSEAIEMKLIFSIYGETYLKVGNYSLNQSLTVRFAITNFEFNGTEREEIPPNTQRMSLLPLNLDGKFLQIRQLQNYDDIVKSLKRTGVDVTCEISLSVENSDELQDIRSIVNVLCKLLTIVRGTLISWIYFDLILPSGEIIFSQHEPRITARYSSELPLIDGTHAEYTSIFLTQCFDNYREINEIYSLDRVVNAYVDVRGGSFLETRGLALVTIIDFLAGTFARINGNATIVDKELFNSKQKLLIERFKKLVNETFPDLPKEKRESMAAKTQSFNYPSFRRRLKNILQHFCVPFDKTEIEEFLLTRNSLVHEARFRSIDTSGVEFDVINHLMDKLLLRMLGYEGYYINVTRFLKQPVWTGSNLDKLTPSC